MPPLTRNNGQRELEVMIAHPARTAHAVATGQQGGLSGTIPGVTSYTVTTTAGSTGVTGSGLDSVVVGGLYAIAGVTGAFTVDSVDSSTHITMAKQIPTTVSDATMIQAPQQVATLMGTIQSYPNGPSPNGDQVAGVGHQVLNNAGNPVVFMGNLSATQTSGTDLPSDFQDGGFAFVDADGNLPAGYSQSTGLWGFGGGALTEIGTWRFAVETQPVNDALSLYYKGTFPGDDTGAGWPADSFVWYDTVQVGPFTFPSDGLILANPYFQADLPVPAPSDNLNAFLLAITISSFDGSQNGVLLPTGGTGVLIPSGSSTGSVNTWTYTAGVGTDIAWDGTSLTTTAGGAFWFILTFSLEFGD